ncbi:hypothetical protein AQUCO_00900222v1 [Aquilegia coerulea]|uniref:Uncharacterized protein n=1 Tax=Aquilegia coerulea TaxID=218851 RepID=A0A2G5ECI7_AQUCA|nr:hypothetical protein AQUCO_00900222v1 [Aquilegia coerulea]
MGAFVFPMVLATSMRKLLKTIASLKKIEEKTPLQILTWSLQLAKSLNMFIFGIIGAATGCLVVIFIALWISKYE